MIASTPRLPPRSSATSDTLPASQAGHPVNGAATYEIHGVARNAGMSHHEVSCHVQHQHRRLARQTRTQRRHKTTKKHMFEFPKLEPRHGKTLKNKTNSASP